MPTIRLAQGRGCALVLRWRRLLSGWHCSESLDTFRLSVVPGSDISAHIESTMLFPTHGVPMQIHPADGKFVSSPITGNIHELVDFDEVPDSVATPFAHGMARRAIHRGGRRSDALAVGYFRKPANCKR